MRIFFMMFAFLGAIAVGSVAFAKGEFLVLAKSDGVGELRTGARASSGQVLRVPEGEVVTLLGRNGRIVQIVGPCKCVLPLVLGAAGVRIGAASREGKIEDGATRSVALDRGKRAHRASKAKPEFHKAAPKLASMLRPPATTRTTASGGTREVITRTKRPPSLWAISVHKEGDSCIRDENAALWRNTAGRTVAIDLRGRTTHLTGLRWTAGKHQMPLPAAIVEDGQAIFVSMERTPRKFTLHVLPTNIADTDWGRILMWMVEVECRLQAKFLIDGIQKGTLFPGAKRRSGLSEL